MSYEVHVINPAPRRRAKKSGKKAMAKKKKSTRRRARRTTTVAAAPRRRRRRASTAAAAPRRRRRRRNPGAPLSRRRRRRNPGLGGLGLGSIKSAVTAAVPRLAGQLAVAFAGKYAERFGGKSAGGNFSTAFGEPWTWQQYAAGAAVALLAPRFLKKFINPAAFTTGALDFLMGKAMFTEVVSRVPGGAKMLGAAPDGATFYEDDGQGYMMDGSSGQMVAMQGLYEAGPYDGLVGSGPMDGIPDYATSTNSDPYAR